MLPYTGAKVVVTGGAGFMGSHVVEELLKQGATVTVLDDLSTGKKHYIEHLLPQVRFIEGSILNERILRKAFHGAEYVFHFAALSSVQKSIEDPIKSHEVNVTGTFKVFYVASEKKIKRVVYASSGAVYGRTEIVPISEDTMPKPETPYAAHKVIMEQYASVFTRLFGLDTVGLRFFNVYGPRQRGDGDDIPAFTAFVERIKGGGAPTIYGDGTATRDFISVHDATRASVEAMIKPGITGEIINIGSGKETTLLDLIALVNAHMHTTIEPVFGPERRGDIHASAADIRKAQSLLGFTATVSLEQGIDELVSAKA